MSQKILEALKARLYATTSLTAAVGSRIYLDVGPANAAFPLLVYRSTSTRTIQIFGGIARHEMNWEFVFYFDNTGSQAIHTAAAALATALSTPLAVTGFDRITMQLVEGGIPSYGDDAWTMTEKYRAVGFDT